MPFRSPRRMPIAGPETALGSTTSSSGSLRAVRNLGRGLGASNRRFHSFPQLPPTFNNLGISSGQYLVPSTQKKPRQNFFAPLRFTAALKIAQGCAGYCKVIAGYWVVGTKYWLLPSGNSQPLLWFLTAGGGLLFPRIPDT